MKHIPRKVRSVLAALPKIVKPCSLSLDAALKVFDTKIALIVSFTIHMIYHRFA